MGWRNAAAADDCTKYVNVRDITVLFSVHSRTVYVWIRRWSHTERGIRIWYHPDLAKPASTRLFHPMLYIHLDDVLFHARAAGYTISPEVAAEIEEVVTHGTE